MRPQVHSPWMSRRRQILTCAALIATSATLGACGSDDSRDLSIPAETSTDLLNKLDQVETRFENGNCSSANSSLNSLRIAVENPETDLSADAREDIKEVLANLQSLISDAAESDEPPCSESVQQTTETESTTSATESSTTSIPEEPSTSSSTSSTRTTDEEPPDTEEPEPKPPSGGGGGTETIPGPGGGSDDSGGTAPREKPGKAKGQSKDKAKDSGKSGGVSPGKPKKDKKARGGPR